MIDLSVSASQLGVIVPYPGMSGVCGLEIRADSINRHVPISGLLKALDIVVSFGQRVTVAAADAMTIIVDMSAISGSYTAHVSITTKNGSSLAGAIKQALGTEREVVIVGRGCK